MSKYEQPSDMWHNFRSPFDRLRANGSAFWGSSSPAVHPSTGSGQTEAHLGDRLPWQFTLRQAQGERITHFGDRLPRLFTLRQAQGERKCTLGIVFPGCSPFDRLRANGSALRGSSSLAVHPSTGSGRTDYALWGSSSPAVHPATGSGRTDCAVNGKAHTLSVASLESSLRHRPRALSDIAQKPSVALPKSPPLRMPLDG